MRWKEYVHESVRILVARRFESRPENLWAFKKRAAVSAAQAQEVSRASAEGLQRNKTSAEAVSIMLGEVLMCRNSLTGLRGACHFHTNTKQRSLSRAL